MPPTKRFHDTFAIRESAGFRVVSAFDTELNRRVVVVTTSARAADDDSRAALARLHAAHEAPAHPAIAPAVELHDCDGAPCVVFDVPATSDLDGVLRALSERGARVTHGEADGMISLLRDALLAQARTLSPSERAARSLGAISFGNVLFAEDGRFWWLGFGHNVATMDARGRRDPRAQSFQAPEVAVGGAPSLEGDFVALLMLARGAVPYVALNAAVLRCVIGNSLAEDVELVRRIVWIERNVIQVAPSRRASIAATVRVSDRIRELVGVWPDPEGFTRHVGRILGSRAAPAPTSRAPLLIASDARWFVRRGEPIVRLDNRRVLRRILGTLADARVLRPGMPVHPEELHRSGWPGERSDRSSAQNRLYVTINGLRRAGLSGDLERADGGYRLSPSTPVARTAGEAPPTSADW